MADIHTLDVVLAAKTAQFNKDIQKETTSIRKMKKDVEQLGSTGTVFKDSFSEFTRSAPVIGGMAGNLTSVAGSLTSAGAAAGPIGIAIAASFAVATAGIVGTVAAVRSLKSQMNEIDDMADAATRIGVSFQELKTIRFSFGESIGLGGSEADGHIAKFQKSLIDASANSSDTLNVMFSKLGMNAGDLLKIGPVKALDEISQKMQVLSEVDQMRLSFELFGKGGLAVVNALSEISTKSKEIDAFLSDRGLKLSNDQVASVAAANDAWDRVALTVDSLVSVVAAEFAPVFSLVADSINDSAGGLKGWTSSISSIVTGGTYFVGVMTDVYEVSTIVYRTLQNISNLDFSGTVGDIKSALDFGTGQRLVDRLEKERKEAMNASDQARQKRDQAGQKGSQFEGIAEQADKEKAAIKQAADEKKQQERELAQLKKQQEQEAKRAREQEARERKQKADQEMAEQKRQREELERRAIDIRKQYNPAFALREQLAELMKLRQAGLIGDGVMQKAALDAAKGSQPQYKGAVSAQAGSVEAYKLIVDRDNSQKENQIALKRIGESQLQISRDMLSHMKKQPQIKVAR